MKMLIGLFSLALSAASFASTVDTKSFNYDGSQNSTELVLRAEKTHTEYSVENVPSTCYRQEVVGYRTICTGGGYYGPGPGPGYPYPGPYPRPYPYPGPGHRSCWQEPIYRSVAYSCIKPVTISREVRDYDVEARVLVDVTKMSQEMTSGERIEVTLKGDELSFNVVGSKKFFAVKRKQDTRSTMAGSVKMIDAVLAVELVEVAPVMKALKISSQKVEDGKLVVKIGQKDASVNLGFSLKVVKKKVLASDKVLFDRELSQNEVEVISTADTSAAGVSLSNLDVKLQDGKFELTTTVFPKFNGTLMNVTQFSPLPVSKKLVYKAK